MLFMIWINQRFQVGFVSERTTDIFRWSAASPIDAAWILDSRSRWTDLFQSKNVFPAVSEIVEVTQLRTDLADDRIQFHSALIERLDLIVETFGVGDFV